MVKKFKKRPGKSHLPKMSTNNIWAYSYKVIEGYMGYRALKEEEVLTIGL